MAVPCFVKVNIPFNLDQIRKVELLPGQQGTKIYNTVLKEGNEFDLLEPLRSAIGSSLVTSLMFDEFNVLVEGAADKPILDGAFELLCPDQKIVVNGSVSESKNCFLARFYRRSKLPFIILLDADSGGRKLASELKKWSISDDHIVQLSTVFKEKGRDFSLECIMSADFYHQAVKETYPELDIAMPSDSTKKKVNEYEGIFKSKHNIGFNKRRVAETVKKLLQRDKADSETKENLKIVTSKIVEQLNAQTSGSPKGTNVKVVKNQE